MSDYPGTQPDAPISEKQERYIHSLARQLKTNPDEEVATFYEAEGLTQLSELTRLQASQLIDALKAQTEG